MKYLYKQGKKKTPVIIALHGTGGNAEAMIELMQSLHTEGSIFSLEGDVLEQGMQRFFKRIRPGVFDLKDLEKRTNALQKFLDNLSKRYVFNRNDVIAIGYSNGANIIANLLYQNPKSLHQVILLQPMLPRDDFHPRGNDGVEVLITAGKNDPIVPFDNTQLLVKSLNESGAEVTVFWHYQGHRISEEMMLHIKQWIQKRSSHQ